MTRPMRPRTCDARRGCTTRAGSWPRIRSIGGRRRGSWRVYDQVLVSHGALDPGAALRMEVGSLRTFREREVADASGHRVRVLRRAGSPCAFTTANGTGVSDHIPLLFEVAVPG